MLMTLLCRFGEAWDLRFPASEEAAFKSDLQAELARSLNMASFAGACAYMVCLAASYSGDPFEYDGRAFCIMVWLSCIAISLVVSVLAFLRSTRGMFKEWDWEAIALSGSIFLILVHTLGNGWQGPQLLGQDPHDIWSLDVRGADTTVALAVDAVLTAVCLFFPIRSCRLWTLQVVALVAYSFAQFVIGSPFPDLAPVNTFVMFMLAGFSYYGSWRNERVARSQWSLARKLGIKERQLLDSFAKSSGLENVTKFLCDIVITLTHDLRVASIEGTRSQMLGSQLHIGAAFCEILKKGDQGRFEKMIRQMAEAHHIPRSTQVTFMIDGQPAEANLLVVATDGTCLQYIIGVDLNSGAVLPPHIHSGFVESSLTNQAIGHPATAVLQKGSEGTFSISMTTMTEELRACVDVAVQAEVLNAACVDTAAQTEIQNAMARPPTLPGRSIAPRQKSNASRRHRKRKQSKASALQANMDHALDGEWEAVDVHSLNDWLHRLHIFGSQVLDGEGGQCHLALDANENVMLEGGVLTLEGEMLVRSGKSGRRTLYSLAVHDCDDSDESGSLCTTAPFDLPSYNPDGEESNEEFLDEMFSLPGSVEDQPAQAEDQSVQDQPAQDELEISPFKSTLHAE